MAHRQATQVGAVDGTGIGLARSDAFRICVVRRRSKQSRGMARLGKDAEGDARAPHRGEVG
jgi:hypothetical protein